jgi:glycosyltransferase involved in cell wall biosynthesis
MGVRLVIAGEGPEKENCEKMAKEFGIADKVKFLGGRTDVGELLAISDIYSLVFDYDRNMGDAEAIGIAGFEGMAAGLPTLIGDFGGANFYMKNWENGVIVKKWDTDDLANCLAKLVNDKSLRSQIGQNATKRIFELLDWSGIIKIYEAIYDKV